MRHGSCTTLRLDNFLSFLSFAWKLKILNCRCINYSIFGLHKYQRLVSYYRQCFGNVEKMATVSDLFQKLKKPEATPVNDDVPEDPPTITTLIERDPAQLAEFDQINESRIQKETDTLISHLNVCEGVVNAAYELRKFVPETINSDQDKLWKEEVRSLSCVIQFYLWS